MKELKQYLKGYRRECLLGPLFKLLEAGFELFVPLVVAKMIDSGISGSDRSLVTKYCLLLIALGFAGFCAAIIAQYFAAKASTGFTAKVRSALFSHLNYLDAAQCDRLGVSKMTTLMTSDTAQVQTGLNLTLRLLLRSPFVVFGAVVMAFTVDAAAARIFAIVVPILFAVVFAIMLVGIRCFSEVQGRLGAVLSAVRESLTGVRVIRAFCAEDRETEKFERRNAALLQKQLFAGRISSLLSPLTYVLINLAVAVLIWQGALRVQSGALSVGAVIALYNYMSQILIELVKMANLVINITKSVACANRIGAVLRQEAPELAENEAQEHKEPLRLSEGAPAVSFSDVSLQYHSGADPALEHIDFSVPAGQTVGIIGPTGCGKTSLISLIPHFYQATNGQVCLFGQPVDTITTASLRREIGLVPQKAQLFSGTIAENLRFGNPDATEEELWQAARDAQCDGVITEKGGLTAPVEQNGRNFSGGQKQRLSVARALVRRPKILILDDSASALDFQTEAALRRAIAHLTWHPTVFIISQRAASIRHAEQILVLQDGALVGTGTHETLYNTCTEYREICDSQEKEAAN